MTPTSKMLEKKKQQKVKTKPVFHVFILCLQKFFYFVF